MRPDLPAGTWCLRLTLDPEAQDAPALQWAIFPEDPRREFTVNLRRVEEHVGRREAIGAERRRGWPAAAWNSVFRSVRGDRVYLLSPPPGEQSLTSNEAGGRKWLATKVVRSGDTECCWSIPFDVAVGQTVQIALDSTNRLTLSELAARDGGA